MMDTAKGLNSFITSNGSFLTIILYAIPAAITMANRAANAIHICKIHQLLQVGLTIGKNSQTKR